MKPEPISVKFKQRKPTLQERQYGPEQVLEARLDFHYFNGKKWNGQTTIETLILIKPSLDDLETYKKIMEMNAWRWLMTQLKAGNIDGDLILAIAEKPIIFKEE